MARWQRELRRVRDSRHQHECDRGSALQLHRLAELSDNVAMAMERMDRTHTALKATTEALSEREGQLAELVEQDRLSEEVKALSGPGTKVRRQREARGGGNACAVQRRLVQRRPYSRRRVWSLRLIMTVALCD